MSIKEFSFIKEIKQFRLIKRNEKISNVCTNISKHYDSETVAILKLNPGTSQKAIIDIYNVESKTIGSNECILAENFHEIKTTNNDILLFNIDEIFQEHPFVNRKFENLTCCKIYDSTNNLAGLIILCSTQKEVSDHKILYFYSFCLGDFFEKEKIEQELSNTLNAFKEQEEALKLQEKELFKFVDEITDQRHEVAEKNKALEDALIQVNFHKQRITNSIRYAKRIQQSILPSQYQFDNHFSESFILYKPKDIVSGDFYWLSESKDKQEVYFGVIDCTGHGVPGALMSMIAYALLEEAIYREDAHSPAVILEYIRKELSKRYQANDQGINDGLDICLCKMISEENSKKVYVSSAKRPFWYVQDGELNIIKGSNIKIEQKSFEKYEPKKFKEHIIELNKDTIMYLFTDGYIDQNNMDRKRFGSKKFEKLIRKINGFSLNKQHKILEETLSAYLSNTEIRDDITVLALKV